jgi:hypothetical protein
MTMFRPWRQDERPTWWARVVHEAAGPLDDADREAVRKQAHETGLAQHVVVTEDAAAGTVTTSMLVKADGAEEAAHVAARVALAAHREAGHGLLGRRLRRTAIRHRPGMALGGPAVQDSD